MHKLSLKLITNQIIFKVRLLRPSLSSWDSEKCEESPADVVVVKLVSLPLSPLHFLFVSAVVNVVASVGNRAAWRSLFHFIHWLNQEFY